MNLRAVRRCVAPALAGAVALVLIVGSMLVTPFRRKAPVPPDYLRAEILTIPSRSGADLVTWLIVPPTPRAAIVVLHGVRATRFDMLSRAELLWRNGFAVLVPDLQAHGESSGDRITFGYLEARDAEAAIAHLRGRFPRLRVGGVGVSLGGAALTLAGDRLKADAVVLEAVYPTIAEAVDSRVRSRLGPVSRILTPLLLLQLKPRLGIGVDDLRPVDAIKTLRCPVLVVSGTADRHTTEGQTRTFYAAANDPKELWLVPGARHVDLLRFDPQGYGSHVIGFLERHLVDRSPGGPNERVLSSPRIGGTLP